MRETADEIKNQIMAQAQALPEVPEEDESLTSTYAEHGIGQDIEVEEAEIDGEEEEAQHEEIDVLPSDSLTEYARQQREKKQERREWDSMSSQEQHDYFKHYGKIPEKPENGQPNFNQEEQAMVGNALESDFMELRDRYGGDLVDRFGADFRIGKVKIPRGIERADNAHEAVFLDWINRSGAFNRLDHRDQRAFLKNAEGPPLKSRARDLVNPEHKRPEPKPRKPRRAVEPRYRAKDVGDRLRQLLESDMKSHPDYYWEQVDE